MAISSTTLDYSSSLREYMVSEKDYLSQHPEYDLVATGAIVFNKEGRLLLVQRAADEQAFPNLWIPGGKVDDTDETIVQAAVRELKEETGLEATRVVRKVSHFTFGDKRPGRPTKTWLKLVFEVEVQSTDDVVLDPIEHQEFVFASEEDIVNDVVGEARLRYISPANKAVKLEAFRVRREGMSSAQQGVA
ncbi:hypothetical protein BDW02DRAFT_354191 [Decorospora gaudefroyi]|uniref:Nudix hydrolase domain-containing protein n=1 Tax=Decorospora gaudefroyi TaxID=184978 RepID=A0A6A5K8F0_9PLEO|nr:hypothetical protein BDW02DRAFT_354191 [Decorospora gaudefroyi]